MSTTPNRTPDERIKEAVEGKAYSALNDDGRAFLDLEKNEESVILYANNFLMQEEAYQLQKGSIVVFDLWRSKGKLQARRIKIKSDPVFSKTMRGLVMDWPWTYGHVNLGKMDHYAHESALADCAYLCPGDVVNVNLDSAGKIARIFKTGEWDPQELSHYEKDLDMGAPKLWIDALLEIIGEDEPWDVYGKAESSILRSYFKFTYLRQQETPNHLVQSGNRMCWNTGLTDRNGDDVLAEFILKRYADGQAGSKYQWTGFLTVANKAATAWRDAPRAKYWEPRDRGDLIYDTDQGIPTIQSDHIGEKIDDRFPPHMRTWPRPDVVRAVQEAAGHAVRRVLQNYKTAIPQFHRAASGRGKGSIQLLLPLRFPGQERPSLALAVRRDGDAYYAATVLKIEWAYTYARLLTKPDTEWLNPFVQQEQLGTG